jgi:general secretion pathway protein G
MRTKGFTLVEILIVVVILGILAAIVIPQFTDASTSARESSLCSDLQMMRSQIELYKVQHMDTMAGITDGATFISHMTTWTDKDGNILAAAQPGVSFGPYMQKVPVNPFAPTATAVAADGINGNVASGAAAGNNTGSWMLTLLPDAASATEATIQADDDKLTPTGQAHTDL